MKMIIGNIFHKLDYFFFGFRPNWFAIWLSKKCGKIVVWSIKA